MTDIAIIAESKKPIPYIYTLLFSEYRFVKQRYDLNTELIKDLYYELENVKGIDYSREKSSFTKERHDERYYRISDKIEELENQNELIKKYIDASEDMIGILNDKSMKEAIRKEYL